MAEFDNTNRGVLFKVEGRRSSNHPNYTGNINIDGEERDLAAWVRKSKKGKIFISIKVEEPEDLTEEIEDEAVEVESDDDIPF
jgi:uncharacterized protein (DUF736 family)